MFKDMEHDGSGDTNCNWCTRNDLKKLDKGTGRVKLDDKVRLNYSIFEIGPNTQKCP